MKRDTKGGGIITQYDGHYTPDLGLLKMDFLGLRTLDVLSIACRNIEERTGTKIVPEEIPTDDEKAFSLMQSGNMDGLFQVEGALYVSLFKRLPPKQFSDVVASIALNRPGPLESGMVEDYIKAAKNPAAVHYYDDRLRPILEETHGTMVYQEQIMQISMAMSGFSAGKSDKLRKAMGKKKLDIMRQLQADWDDGRRGQRLSARDRPADLGRRREVREVRLQQVAFGRLRHPRDAHGLPEGALPERLHGRRAHQLHGQHRPPHPLHRQLQQERHAGAAAGHQRLPRRVHPGRGRHPLRFGGRARRGQERRRRDHRRARGERPVHLAARLREPARREVLQPQDARGPHQGRRVRLHRATPASSSCTSWRRRRFWKARPSARRTATAGQVSMFDMFADDADSGFQEDVPAPDGVEWDKRTKLAYEKEIMKIYVSEHPLAPFEGTLRRMSPLRHGHALAEQHQGDQERRVRGHDLECGDEAHEARHEDGHVHPGGHHRLTSSASASSTTTLPRSSRRTSSRRSRASSSSGDRGNQIMAFELEALELNEEDARPSHLELRVPSRSTSTRTARRT